MIYVTPIYSQVPVRVAVGSLLLMLGLIGIYSLIHIVGSRRIVAFGPFLGAIVANGLLVALYVAGASGLAILGHGKGQLAAVTFLGVSLLVGGAGRRTHSRCSRIQSQFPRFAETRARHKPEAIHSQSGRRLRRVSRSIRRRAYDPEFGAGAAGAGTGHDFLGRLFRYRREAFRSRFWQNY